MPSKFQFNSPSSLQDPPELGRGFDGNATSTPGRGAFPAPPAMIPPPPVPPSNTYADVANKQMSLQQKMRDLQTTERQVWEMEERYILTQANPLGNILKGMSLRIPTSIPANLTGLEIFQTKFCWKKPSCVSLHTNRIRELLKVRHAVSQRHARPS